MEHRATWNSCEIWLHQSDITALDVDAIVNAANSGLRGGAGVDGAIHQRGGKAILDECLEIISEIGSLPPGEAVLTTGGNLAARHVIHTVGPIFDDDADSAPALLAASYRNSLKIARENSIRTIAFPCISTGVYGYPANDACQVAIETIRSQVTSRGNIDRVVFCTYGARDFQLYDEQLNRER